MSLYLHESAPKPVPAWASSTCMSQHLSQHLHEPAPAWASTWASTCVIQHLSYHFRNHRSQKANTRTENVIEIEDRRQLFCFQGGVLPVKMRRELLLFSLFPLLCCQEGGEHELTTVRTNAYAASGVPSTRQGEFWIPVVFLYVSIIS